MYQAELCYTPMFHAATFARDEKYRAKMFETNPEDRSSRFLCELININIVAFGKIIKLCCL
jgi:hypothetical protein